MFSVMISAAAFAFSSFMFLAFALLLFLDRGQSEFEMVQDRLKYGQYSFWKLIFLAVVWAASGIYLFG